MDRDTIQLEDAVSTISQEYLLEFTSEYGIPESLHPELPGPEEPIVEFPEGKVVIGVAKVSHFEINCRVLNIIPTLNLFRVFYVPSYNSGWMSFSKGLGKNTPQCYTKPLDSLKNWNKRFFWVNERIFPTVVEWRTNAPKEGIPSANSYSAEDVTALDTHHMDLFNLISAINPAKVKTETRPRAAHEVPLLTVTASRVIDIGDTTVASGSSGTPSALEKLPLDFANENPPPLITERDGMEDQVQDRLSREILPVENPTTTEVVLEPNLEKEVAAIGPLVNKRRRKRGNDEADANALPKVLRKDHAAFRPAQIPLEGKSLTSIGLEAGSTFFTPALQETPADAKNVSDPDPLSYAKPQPHPRRDVAHHTNKSHVPHNVNAGLPRKRPPRSSPEILLPRRCKAKFLRRVRSQGNRPPSRLWTGRQEVSISQKGHNQDSQTGSKDPSEGGRDKKVGSEIKSLRAVETEVHDLHNQTKNLEALLEAEVDMKKAAEAKNAKLTKEVESLRV
ncbi:hypothetical protein Tco_0456577 [Tanacetum coccineum]